MKALVTGSAGFLGRHFLAELRSRGHDTLGVDIRHAGSVRSLVLDANRVFRGSELPYGFDLVVHCAAHEPHRAAIDGDPMHLARNLQLDAAMFEWAVQSGQRRVLYISSSAAYPIDLQDDHATARELREDDIRIHPGRKNIGGPDAGYGWLKLTGERLAADAAEAGLPVHIVRPFSGYGADQGERFPFGAFLARAKRRDDPFTIWGDGGQVRDWIHVDDVVRGALAVVDADERRPVNLCTGVGTSMVELARMFCRAAGYDPEFELRGDQPAGVAFRVGDPSRMNGLYKATVSLEEGVERALRATAR